MMCWTGKGLGARAWSQAVLIQGLSLWMTGPVSWDLAFLIWKLALLILVSQILW